MMINDQIVVTFSSKKTREMSKSLAAPINFFDTCVEAGSGWTNQHAPVD